MVERAREKRQIKITSKKQAKLDEETRVTADRLKLVRSQVAQLMARTFDSQPQWKENIQYFISWSEEKLWQANFAQLALFFKDFSASQLVGIEIQKFKTQPETLKKILEIRFIFQPTNHQEEVFLGFRVDSDFKTSVAMNLEKTAGPAKYYQYLENKSRTPASEIIRLITIAQVLHWIVEQKQNSPPAEKLIT